MALAPLSNGSCLNGVCEQLHLIEWFVGLACNVQKEAGLYTEWG